MSRIGQKEIEVPSGVEVNLSGNVLSVKGPKGDLSMTVHDQIEVRVEGSCVYVTRKNDAPKLKALHGLNRSLIANMIEGASKGYVRELEIQGVGFKAAVQDKKAIFALGFSSPFELAIPDGVGMEVHNNVNVVISSADKQMVGDFAARVKSLYPAEPYKGKGIRFKGESVRRKVGKTVA